MAVFFGLFVMLWLALINLPAERFRSRAGDVPAGGVELLCFQRTAVGKGRDLHLRSAGIYHDEHVFGYLLASRIGFDLALKGVASLMAALAVRLRPVLRWWFAVNVAFFSAVSLDAVYVFAIALSACLAIESSLSPGLALGVGVLFAFVSLTKFRVSCKAGPVCWSSSRTHCQNGNGFGRVDW